MKSRRADKFRTEEFFTHYRFYPLKKILGCFAMKSRRHHVNILLHHVNKVKHVSLHFSYFSCSFWKIFQKILQWDSERQNYPTQLRIEQNIFYLSFFSFLFLRTFQKQFMIQRRNIYFLQTTLEQNINLSLLLFYGWFQDIFRSNW